MLEMIKDVSKRYKTKLAYALYDQNDIFSRTYGQIIQESELLKKYFINYPQNVCLAIYMNNNPCIPMLILSLIECRIAFIILDPSKSVEYNESIVEELDLYAVIVSEDAFLVWIDTWEKQSFRSEFESKIRIAKNPNFQKLKSHDYENIIYVMQTSGTTGIKKVVKVTEACIKSNIEFLKNKFQINGNDVIYFGTPFTFDPSMVELFSALTSGALLLSVSNEIKNNIPLLFQNLFSKPDHNVTILQMCPSVFLQFSTMEINFIFNKSTLRCLALGGEPFPETLLKFKHSSKLRLYNLYGITEVSCWASICEFGKEIHLGEIMSDTIFEVRDSEGCKVEEGEGVLYIGSNTRLCFMNGESASTTPRPLFRSTGDLVLLKNKKFYYRGRANETIKRFGHRINLHLLENQVTSSINLCNKCIWLENFRKLAIFILIPECENLAKDKIIDKIRVKLVKEMDHIFLPDHIEIIKEFPLTDNGKVDRSTLELLVLDALSKNNSDNCLHKFCTLWCKYLGLTMEEVEVIKEKTFIEMGGSSIMRIQFISEFSNLVDIDINFRNALFDDSFGNICEYLQKKDLIKENSNFEILWKYNMHACIDTTVAIFENDHQKIVAVGNFANLFVVLDAKTGKENLKIWLPDVIENSCKITKDCKFIYVGCFDGYMYCLSLGNLEIKWKFKTQDRIKNTPIFVLKDSALCFASYDKHIYTVNKLNGELIWSVNFNEAVTADLQILNETIVTAGLNGTIACLKEENGDFLWKYKTKNPIFASFEMYQEKYIIISDICGNFYCIESCKGNVKWIYESTSKSNMYSSFLIYKSNIIFGMKDKYVYILEFNESMCFLKYSICINHEISVKPALVTNFNENCVVIIVTNDGYIHLYKFNDTSLVLMSYMVLGFKTFTNPVICDNLLYLGCRDNHLYCIKINV